MISGVYGTFLTVGAIDGKHVVIKAPRNAGSGFYNYKHCHSVILMALVDARCRFIIIDVGAYGRESDGGVFSLSEFGKKMLEGRLDLPDPKRLPSSDITCPHVFLGYAAFPLRTNLMKPYPGQGLESELAIFNYRPSRARRNVENAFGILSARWRIYRRPIESQPDKVDFIIKATVALHNYIKDTDDINPPGVRYNPPGFADHEEHTGNVICGDYHKITASENILTETSRLTSHTSSAIAHETRDNFKQYFQLPQGKVPWQNNINRGSINKDNPPEIPM